MSSNPQNLADDGLERIKALDVLTTLPELLTHHLTVRPDDVAYKVYDNGSKSWKDLTFKNVYDQVHAWRHAFAARSELVRGDRVAMLLPNCPEAVFFDLSALSNTLVPVPLHAIDTPKSSAFILNDSGAKVLVTNKLLKWKQIREAAETPEIRLVVITDDKDCDDLEAPIPVMTKETFLKLGETAAQVIDISGDVFWFHNAPIPNSRPPERGECSGAVTQKRACRTRTFRQAREIGFKTAVTPSCNGG